MLGATEMRVAFLTNVVAPYRVPLLEELATTPGWELRVFVNSRNEFDRHWSGVAAGVDVANTRTLSFRRRVRTTQPVACEQLVELHIPVSLWLDLARFKPDVVISLELGPRTALAACYCKLRGIPLVIWSYQSRASMSMTGGLRRLVRGWLLRQARSLVGMGSQARAVLERFGVPADSVFDAPNAPAHAAIEARLRSADHCGGVARIRERFPGCRIALVVGRLVPMKTADRIVAAWTALAPETRSNWRLLFLGDGPLAPVAQGLEGEGIHHLGQVPSREVPDYLRAASLQIFASLVDVWGLVVTEGMLCGTPALCSIHAGCAEDVIRHGIDGWLFDPMDPKAWCSQLHDLLTREDLAAAGNRARVSAQRFSIVAMARGFRGAVGSAIERSAPVDSGMRTVQ